MCHDSFTFLGLQVDQKDDGITVSQSIYIEEIEPIDMLMTGNKKRRFEDEEKKSLRSAIGQISWISNQTRPDISFHTCKLSTT